MERDENYIKEIIKSNIELPIHYQNVVRKTLYECKHKNKLKSFAKIIGTVCACIIMTTGIVYGSYIVYEKIWKEPEEYTRQEYLSTVPNEVISNEEKVSYITEEQAKEKALEVLNRLGYENQTINRIELKRSYSNYSSAYYMVKTKYGYEEGLMVTINAENGEFDHFEDMELKYKNTTPDNITEEEAKQIGREVYKQIGLKEGEYEFFSAEQQEQLFQEKSMNVWSVEFQKKINGIFNKNEAFGVVFIVENSKVKLVSMGIRHDTNFQNDDIKITKEQAISIALEKEAEYSTEEIKEIAAELSIEKMNTFFYRLDNDTKDKYLKIDDISRKVWKVKIIHENTNSMNKFDRCYYIDCATGEIIGGELIK